MADATASVLTKQRQLFLEKWTLAPISPAPASQQLSLTQITDAAPTLQIAPASAADALQQASQPVLAARGSQLLLEFAIHAATDDPAPLLVIQPPNRQDRRWR